MAAPLSFGVRNVQMRGWQLHLSTEMSQTTFPYIACQVNLVSSGHLKCQDVTIVVMRVSKI